MNREKTSELTDSTKLSILFLCSWYPNQDNPTLGNFVKRHKDSIPHPVKTCVLACFSSKLTKLSIERDETERIVRYPKKKIYIPIVGHFFRFIQLWLLYLRAFKELKNENGNFNLVHLNVVYPAGFFALYLKWVHKIPFVVTEHSTAYAPGTTYLSSFQRHYCKFILKRAACLLPVSKDLGKTLQQYAPNVPQQVITNVVDETIFQALEEKSFDAINEKKTLLHVSTLHADKNILGLLEAVANLSKIRSDFKLRIITDGDIKAPSEFCREHNLLNSFVFFEGSKKSTEIASAMQESKALVLFSNAENFPCVLPESWMCGIPIISTAINGIPEYVSRENGILVPKGDQHALVEAMQTILNDSYPFDTKLIRQEALKIFSKDAIGKQFVSIYERYSKK